MRSSPYQILPDLLPEEYESLRASIADRGVDIPIIVDQDGNVIDGFHREKACGELGIYCPREVRQFGNEAEKYELILRTNCRRRQLNRKQKEKLIETYLLRDPQIADNNLGNVIGISKNTVAKVRSHLEATCQIDKFERLRGQDGKERPVKYRKIIANTPKEAEVALKIIGDLPENCEGKTLDVTTAQRRARRNVKQEESQEAVITPLAGDAIQIHHCRFQELETLAGLQPNSVNLVCTDIPYGQEFLPQISELAATASRVLVEGGLFITYCGQFHLPEVIQRFGEHLSYRWTCAAVWEGDSNVIYALGIASQWKPILIYSKGPWEKTGRYSDVFWMSVKEKTHHDWQQPLGDVEKLIERFSKPGDLVVDFCGGAFTTAIACHRLGRRFVGCDIDQAAVAIGQERLAQERASDAPESGDSRAKGVEQRADNQAKLLERLQIWIEELRGHNAVRTKTRSQGPPQPPVGCSGALDKSQWEGCEGFGRVSETPA